MRRREFIAMLCSGAAYWPAGVHAQQHDKVRTIALVGDNGSVWRPWTTAFADRMRELGWIENRDVAFVYRWTEGRPEAVSDIARELVQRKVDVIVSYGGAVRSLNQATNSIPIVFAIAVDPLGIGLVPSLSHPGGNVTGLSIQSTDLAGKRLELLREFVPRLHRLAIIFDASYPAAARGNKEVQAAASALGIEVAPHEIRRAEDISSVFYALKDHADALYVVENALVSANSVQIGTLALNAKLPMMFNVGDVAQIGSLLSYGPDFSTMFARAADLVDKILRGAKPGDLPVEQPTKFRFVVNLKTARTLGLTVPDRVLALADEVIE
jgi:putative tryptophan/tyrosine transport system substrate-binding protein